MEKKDQKMLSSDDVLERRMEGINDILGKKQKFTFLVGAGISMENPSNLPSARDISRVLLEICAPPEEVEQMLKLDGLRYELIVEKIQFFYDKELAFMNYFEEITDPNIIHYFLANAILRENFVVTTNFDYLIEFALMRIMDEKEYSTILPIITKDDFQKYSNPHEVIRSKYKPLYKIHGSKKNIITGALTTDTLITTISSLGKDREEGATFAIEPFKKPAVDNMMRGTTLIVMGYSGSDDFDIGPVLKELSDVSSIIWIDHRSSTDPTVFRVKKVEIDSEGLQLKNLSRTDKLLTEIRHDVNFEVYKVECHTGLFVKDFLWPNILPGIDLTKHKLKVIDDDVRKLFKDWVTPKFEIPSEIRIYKFACNIYHSLGFLEGLLRCAEKGLVYAKEVLEKGDEVSYSNFINYIGMVQEKRSNYDAAIKNFSAAMDFALKTNNIKSAGVYTSNVAHIYAAKGETQKAIENFDKAIKFAEQMDDKDGLSLRLSSMGDLYIKMALYDKAEEVLKKAQKLSEMTGNLSNKATFLNNLGLLYREQGFYEKALKYYKEAYEIAQQLGDQNNMSTYISNMGFAMSGEKKYQEALEYYNKSLQINLANNAVREISTDYNNIAKIYNDLKDLDNALLYYHKSVDAAKSIGYLSGLQTTLLNLGDTYKEKGDMVKAEQYLKDGYDAAVKLKIDRLIDVAATVLATFYDEMNRYDDSIQYYKIALAAVLKYGSDKEKSVNYNNLGYTYYEHGDYSNALDPLIQAAGLKFKIGDIEGTAKIHKSLGKAYLKLNDTQKALENFEQGLKLVENIDLPKLNVDLNVSIASIYYDQIKNSEALKYYLVCVPLYEKLGDSENLMYILSNIGYLYYKINNYEKGIEYCLKASAIARERNDQDQIGYNYINLGDIYKKLNKIPESCDYYKKAIEAYKKSGEDTKSIIKFYTTLSDMCLGAGDIVGAIEATREMIECYQKINNETGKDFINLDTAKRNLGELYRRKGDYTEALRVLNDLLPFEEKSDIKGGMGFTLYTIGYTYENLKRWGDGEEPYRKSIEIATKLNDEVNLALRRTRLGVVLKNQSKFEEALDYLNSALEYYKKSGISKSIASQYSQIADVYYRKKDYTTAIIWYEKCRDLYNEMGDKKNYDVLVKNIENAKIKIQKN